MALSSSILPSQDVMLVKDNKMSWQWYNWFTQRFLDLRDLVRVFDTSSTASAGAATLPANPLGFIETKLPDGTAVKIPYYNL